MGGSLTCLGGRSWFFRRFAVIHGVAVVLVVV